MAPRSLALACILIASAATAACDTPANPAEPGQVVSASMKAEPDSLKPQFIQRGCLARPAFLLRVSVVVRHGPGAIRGLRFTFIDRSGTRVLPIVSLAPDVPSSSPIPTAGTPIPLPSAAPIPIPGVAPLTSFPASGTLPFVVTFGCDVVPEGTLIVIGDLDDGRTTETRVRVGS